MAESHQLLIPLTEKLMEAVKDYGILEVSLPQYQFVCKSIIRFAEKSKVEHYSADLMESYKEHIKQKNTEGKICKEYLRFQYRVVRMLISLSENGTVDFSSTKGGPRKYIVSDRAQSIVEAILDSRPMSDATKKDLRTPTRHFLWYAEQKGITPERIDDSLVMSYLINEIPVSNSGSTGRTLRTVKYATEYLKLHGNHHLYRDYTLLKLKNEHRRIIPAYSEKEIADIANAASVDDALCKRDMAIILLAYCTGLRGIDIIRIRLSDIDWHNHKVSVVQSKTHTPIVAELNGATMNALADYILDWRPETALPEVFITVKAPYRSLSKGFGGMIDKYCKKAGVPKIALRGFHSIRRSFETSMVSRGVPIETASQMMGHKTIAEDKPYITYNKKQVSFVALDFSEVPINFGYYASNKHEPGSSDGGGIS